MAERGDPPRNVAVWIEGVLSKAVRSGVAREARFPVGWSGPPWPTEADGVGAPAREVLVPALRVADGPDPERASAVIGSTGCSRFDSRPSPSPDAEDLPHMVPFCLAGIDHRSRSS